MATDARNRRILETKALVEQTLRQCELRYNEIAMDSFRLVFQGENLKDIIVCLRIQVQWVQIFCLYGHPTPEAVGRVSAWALRMGHTLPLVKFALTEDNEFYLQVDVAEEAVGLRVFQTAIRALVTTADELYPEFLDVLHG